MKSGTHNEECLVCGAPAVWERSTQFAGDHPYCKEHAEAQSDFGENDSYTFWRELKAINLPKWIDQVDEGGYQESDFESEQYRITKARYDVLMSEKKSLTCIIAGGRDIHDYQLVKDAIAECQFPITTVVSGGAKGVDALGEQYSEEMGLNLKIFRADWATHGRAAGPIRNRKMAENADALIAIWDGKSKGTKNMIETAQKKGLLVYVKRIDDGTDQSTQN